MSDALPDAPSYTGYYYSYNWVFWAVVGLVVLVAIYTHTYAKNIVLENDLTVDYTTSGDDK